MIKRSITIIVIILAALGSLGSLLMLLMGAGNFNPAVTAFWMIVLGTSIYYERRATHKDS